MEGESEVVRSKRWRIARTQRPRANSSKAVKSLMKCPIHTYWEIFVHLGSVSEEDSDSGGRQRKPSTQTRVGVPTVDLCYRLMIAKETSKRFTIVQVVGFARLLHVTTMATRFRNGHRPSSDTETVSAIELLM